MVNETLVTVKLHSDVMHSAIPVIIPVLLTFTQNNAVSWQVSVTSLSYSQLHRATRDLDVTTSLNVTKIYGRNVTVSSSLSPS